MEQKTESYYKDPKDNIAFERCIEVMSWLIMKYGPGLLEKMNREKIKSLICSEIESGTAYSTGIHPPADCISDGV